MAEKRVVKCEGRFPELREYIFDQPVDMILQGRTLVTPQEMRDLWSLIEGDIFGYDPKDPYYASTFDKPRKQPELTANSLVPLFPDDFVLERGLVTVYALEQGVPIELAGRIETLSSEKERFFVETLGTEPSRIIFPNGRNLEGYVVHTGFGIGSLSKGGVQGGGIRSDAPFLVEIHRKSGKGELDLAAVLGFWAQQETMLVAQMQPCKNAELPQGVSLGIACLVTGEHIARRMGFKEIEVYTAKSHPTFRTHPQGWAQYGQDFVRNSDEAVAIIKGYTLSNRDTWIKKF